MDKRSVKAIKTAVRRSNDRGEAIYIQTSKGLFPWSTLQRFAKSESQQLKEQDWGADQGLKAHPFSPTMLLQLKENCSYLDACCKQLATDVAGKGFYTEVKSGKEVEEPADDATSEEKAAVDKAKAAQEEQQKRVDNLLEMMNHEDESLRVVLRNAVEDWATLGWLTIEVTRDADNHVDGLFHVPAHTVKVHKDRNKFCQLRDTRKVWFKRFGLPDDIDRRTGEPCAKGAKTKANELLFYKSYYAASTYYGAPLYLSTVGSVHGLIGIRDYNIAFFENYGVPAALIKLSGKWKPGSVQKIVEFLDVEIKGSDKAHKTMVLKVPEGGTVEWIPMSMDKKEGHFSLQKKDFREDVLVTFRMPPYRIGIAEQGSLGGNLGWETTRIYVDSVVEPLQTDLEEILTLEILEEGLECPDLAAVFADIDLRDRKAEVDMCDRLMRLASMTPNQIREQLNLGDPYEGGNQYYIDASLVPIGQGEVGKLLDADERQLGMVRSEVSRLLTRHREQIKADLAAATTAAANQAKTKEE